MGDATRASASRRDSKIIAHVCNDAGSWGRGFVLAVSRRWHAPEACYRTWHRQKDGKKVLRPEGCELLLTSGEFSLGQSQLVQVEKGTYVLNMIAQEGFGPSSGPRVHYGALALCLVRLEDSALLLGADVHMPRIGCGLGGGDWGKVSALVERLVSAPTFVYDLPP